MVQRVVLRLLQALTDSELQNTVIGVLTACRDLDVTVPSGIIERNSDSPSVHVPAVIRGRTATELLVDCNVTGISSRKLVAVNYVTLLNHANLDCLLQLAKKVQARMLLRTPSLMIGGTAPENKALARLGHAIATADAAVKHAAGASLPAAELSEGHCGYRVALSPSRSISGPSESTVAKALEDEHTEALTHSDESEAVGGEQQRDCDWQTSAAAVPVRNPSCDDVCRATGSAAALVADGKAASPNRDADAHDSWHLLVLSPSSPSRKPAMPMFCSAADQHVRPVHHRAAGLAVQSGMQEEGFPVPQSSSPFLLVANQATWRDMSPMPCTLQSSPELNGGGADRAIPTAGQLQHAQALLVNRRSLQTAPSGWDFSCLPPSTAKSSILVADPGAKLVEPAPCVCGPHVAAPGRGHPGTGPALSTQQLDTPAGTARCAPADAGTTTALAPVGEHGSQAPGTEMITHGQDVGSALACGKVLEGCSGAPGVTQDIIGFRLQPLDSGVRPSKASAADATGEACLQFKAALYHASAALQHLHAGVGALKGGGKGQSLACAAALCHLSTAGALHDGLEGFVAEQGWT